ncbi:hypothetical protein V6R21_12630 [Limibacter armeniacum]|uniref:hypothetical protein n=1 Tax=Limibacter armeniacum TaxID=466084 RepID=UPI002FE67AE2
MKNITYVFSLLIMSALFACDSPNDKVRQESLELDKEQVTSRGTEMDDKDLEVITRGYELDKSLKTAEDTAPNTLVITKEEYYSNEGVVKDESEIASEQITEDQVKKEVREAVSMIEKFVTQERAIMFNQLNTRLDSIDNQIDELEAHLSEHTENLQNNLKDLREQNTELRDKIKTFGDDNRINWDQMENEFNMSMDSIQERLEKVLDEERKYKDMNIGGKKS